MQGREYLEVARELAARATEKHWRTAAGRAYYGLFLECREALLRWGFATAARQNVHHFVRQHFNFPMDADLKRIGRILDDLAALRNRADYDLAPMPAFASPRRARRAAQDATAALTLVDAIDADASRRAAAVAAIRVAFP